MDKEKHRPAGSNKPPFIPPDMKAFNEAIVKEFRANGGRLGGQMAGRELMLLTTTGVRSGQQRTVVLGFRTDGDRYLIIASANGAPSHPAWYQNLLAHPVATVEVGAEKFQARATTAGEHERDSLGAKVPYLESQQKLTSREIPVVILERV